MSVDTVAHRSAPMWVMCPGCRRTSYREKLEREHHVCSYCGHHLRVGVNARISQLVDPGTWQVANVIAETRDHLGFVDSRTYPERLEEARARLGLEDAACRGTARINGHEVSLVVMDFGFLGGSMGTAVGEEITRAAEEALERRIPLVMVIASGGARMQEGTLSLMQMAKTAIAVKKARDAGVLTVSVLTDPTFGGVTASFATTSDLLIAEKGALIGFAGPRVIVQATGQDLPHGFQSAEFLWEAGLVDRVESRAALSAVLGRVLDLLARPELRSAESGPVTSQAPHVAPTGNAYETVRMARNTDRPTTRDYIDLVCDDFVEFHGDRLAGDDPAIVAGLAAIGTRRVFLIGHQKGRTTSERLACNFGMPHPEGYRKALRIMRLAQRQGLPVVTFVDTQGAAPGVEAERTGQSWAISECIAGMAELEVPTVSVVTGEGGSGGALAMAVSDRVLMLENSFYSVISPESCSTILRGDASHGAAMAEALQITAPALVGLGIVDGVIPEPPGGAHTDHRTAAAQLRAALLATLAELDGTPVDRIVRERRDRYRNHGRNG